MIKKGDYVKYVNFHRVGIVSAVRRNLFKIQWTTDVTGSIKNPGWYFLSELRKITKEEYEQRVLAYELQR